MLDKSAKPIIFCVDDGVKYKLVPSNSIAPATGVVNFEAANGIVGENINGATVLEPALRCKRDNGVGIPIPMLPLLKTLNKLGSAVVLRPKVNVPKSIVVGAVSAPPSFTEVTVPVPVAGTPVNPFVTCALAVNISVQNAIKKSAFFICIILS
ncbi:MAG: hypothetical protein H7320_19995 [Ferruginibacter sp.]|nr:hypothetical protein [Ferruginibacter sp.]